MQTKPIKYKKNKKSTQIKSSPESEISTEIFKVDNKKIKEPEVNDGYISDAVNKKIVKEKGNRNKIPL